MTRQFHLAIVLGVSLLSLSSCDQGETASQQSQVGQPEQATSGAALKTAAAPVRPAGGATRSLTFGIYTSDKATDMIRQFAPVTKALDAALNAGSAGSWMIRVVVYDTYEGAVEALVKGEIDFSRTGPASYIHAKQKNPGVRLLAMETKDRAAAKRVFRGVICVHKDSSIDSIEDLAGKRFAFGSKTSTIGRYLAQELLIKNGIKRTDLEGASYLGRHDRVGLAVARGTFDAGALKESTFKKLVAAGEPLRQLTSFENVTKPWMSRPGLSTSSYDALRAALLDLRDAAALGALKKDGFLPAEDRHYDPIRAAIKAAEGFGT